MFIAQTYTAARCESPSNELIENILAQGGPTNLHVYHRFIYRFPRIESKTRVRCVFFLFPNVNLIVIAFCALDCLNTYTIRKYIY